MQIDTAYCVGIHPHSFRRGVPAEIIGIGIITPKIADKPRACFHVKYSDMTEHWIAIGDHDTYKIISFTDIVEGKIPK